ncbi:MAG: hypothetical protein AAFZ63_18400 [Bacteroidota bacterium]
MKKHIALLAFSTFLTISSWPSLFGQDFMFTDIERFWEAYDEIVAKQDSVEQLRLLQELYIDRASPGLEAVMEVRNYTAEEYVQAIRNYPRFWESIRAQTLKVPDQLPAIEAKLELLRQAYPELKPVPVYFTVGAFRTGGTTHEGKVLIGTELSMANEQTVIDELPDWRQPFYRESTPINDLPLLCTHEYIHTQQNELQHDLLSMCLYEGAAEFVSCVVTDLPSSSPAISFGKNNRERVVKRFVVDLFSGSNNYNWMWGSNNNELKIRDLGYYIGYEICERYYNNASDKKVAIRELIELDFTDRAAIERLVDQSKLLPKSVATLREDYERSRPTVVEILEFENGSNTVDPSIESITVRFSQALNGYHAGIDFGPLGKDYCPKMDPRGRSWGEENQSYTVPVSLEPNQHYQFTIPSSFRTEDGIRLQPHIIEFKTAR